MSLLTIAFHIALNASQDEVIEVIDAIRHQFGIEESAGVAPAVVLVGQSGAALPADVVQNTTGKEVDAEGLPWDERIHSGSKEKNKDGTWRAKRGVTPQLLGKVKKELLATMSAPAPTATVTTPAPVATTTLAAPGSLPAPGGLPPIPGANVPTEAPAYTAFVKFVADNTNSPTNPAGRLTADWVNQAIAHFGGVPELNLQSLAHRADLIPQIEAGIRTSLGQ